MCSVDPFLFKNFLTEDGDLLRAEFQAFKFPETNFVLFKGVVNVCLNKCNGVECSNGLIGYGRKRRNVDDESAEKDNFFEVSMSTIVKVGDDEKTEVVYNGKRESFIAERAILGQTYHSDDLALARLSEEFGSAKYMYFQTDEDDTTRTNSASNLIISLFAFAAQIAIAALI